MIAQNIPGQFPDAQHLPEEDSSSNDIGSDANDPLYNTTGIPPHTVEKNGLPKPAHPRKINDIEDALDDEEDDRDRFPKPASDL